MPAVFYVVRSNFATFLFSPQRQIFFTGEKLWQKRSQKPVKNGDEMHIC